MRKNKKNSSIYVLLTTKILHVFLKGLSLQIKFLSYEIGHNKIH